MITGRDYGPSTVEDLKAVTRLKLDELMAQLTRLTDLVGNINSRDPAEERLMGGGKREAKVLALMDIQRHLDDATVAIDAVGQAVGNGCFIRGFEEIFR